MFRPFFVMKRTGIAIRSSVKPVPRPLALIVAALAIALVGAAEPEGRVVYEETFDTSSNQSIAEVGEGWDGWAGKAGKNIDETTTEFNHTGVFTRIYNRNGSTGRRLSDPDSIRHDKISPNANAIAGRVLLFTTHDAMRESITSSQLGSIRFDITANNFFAARAVVNVDVDGDGERGDDEWYASEAADVMGIPGSFSKTAFSVSHSSSPDWTQVDLKPGTTLDLTSNTGPLPDGNVLAVGFYVNETPDTADDDSSTYALDNYRVLATQAGP